MVWTEKRNSGGVLVERVPAPPAPSIATITVCVVLESRLKCETLAWTLEQVPGMRAIAAVRADREVLDYADPDVMLIDAALHDSVHIAVDLRRTHPRARVVVMNLGTANEEIGNFVKAGVVGFALRDASLEEFVGTLKDVADGKTVLPSGLTQMLFTRVRDAANPSTERVGEPRVQFTRREHEVVDLVCDGLQNRAIGKRLNISCHTVRSHVRNVLAKLALHSRHQLAAWAHRDHGTARW